MVGGSRSDAFSGSASLEIVNTGQRKARSDQIRSGNSSHRRSSHSSPSFRQPSPRRSSSYIVLVAERASPQSATSSVIVPRWRGNKRNTPRSKVMDPLPDQEETSGLKSSITLAARRNGDACFCFRFTRNASIEERRHGRMGRFTAGGWMVLLLFRGTKERSV